MKKQDDTHREETHEYENTPLQIEVGPTTEELEAEEKRRGIIAIILAEKMRREAC